MINNTLPIFRQNCKEFANNTDGVTITSLEIAKLTGKSHIHIMRDIREILGKIRDVSKFGYIYKDSYGREQNCFALPKTEALILVSGYSVELREKIILRLEFLENELKKQSTPQLPQSFAEALKLAYEQQLKIEQMQVEMQKQAPLVEFANNIAVSVNSRSIGDFAKILSNNENIAIGEKRLFAWLRAHGYLQNNNMPYQKYVDCGYFAIKQGTYATEKGIKNYTQTLITGKGQIYFSKKLQGDL